MKPLLGTPPKMRIMGLPVKVGRPQLTGDPLLSSISKAAEMTSHAKVVFERAAAHETQAGLPSTPSVLRGKGTEVGRRLRREEAALNKSRIVGMGYMCEVGVETCTGTETLVREAVIQAGRELWSMIGRWLVKRVGERTWSIGQEAHRCH